MKKRCTNSACRRVFRMPKAPAAVVCPHCGRVYSQGAAVQVQVEICGVIPGMKMPLLKAIRQHLNCGLREAKERTEELCHMPLALAPMSAEEALAESSRWQQVGGVTRLVELVPGGMKPCLSRYSVVMTGWRPGCGQDAWQIARQALPDLPFCSRREAMGRVNSHPIVLEQNLQEPEARARAEAYRQKGICAQIRKQRAG